MSESKDELRLLIMIARNESALDELMTGLLDVGITGATIIEAKGMGAILRQEMPMFAGLASLLPQQTGSRVIVSAVAIHRIDRMERYIEEMHPDDRPIMIVLPVEKVSGLNLT